MLGNWGKVFIWGLLVLSFMESSILIFKWFFIWSVNCSSHFLSHFLSLISCISWVFDFRDVQKLKHKFIFEIFYYCYLWKFQFASFLPIQTFFWSVNCVSLVFKLCLISDHLRLWAVLILEFFSSDILRRVSLILSFFSCFFLIFKLYKSGLYIMA